MDIWQYVEDRRRELRDLSLAGDDTLLQAAEETGSDGQRGRILGRAFLTDRAYIQFHEIVVVRGSGITREKYAYYLCVDDKEIGGYERDPLHSNMVEHNALLEAR